MFAGPNNSVHRPLVSERVLKSPSICRSKVLV
jgi:hypothetical protein